MNNGLRLFRVAGVDVYVDWTWAIVVVYLYIAYQGGTGIFTREPHGPLFWVAFLFCYMSIVLLHEFGHVFACRWVGGRVDRVRLTFFGGLAQVHPPQRASAWLWSIAGGPLVNMLLVPVTLFPSIYLWWTGRGFVGGAGADFLAQIALVNTFLLVFNLLPVYPMDGGQILRALLWFVCGRAWSLIIAGAIGIAGCSVLILVALFYGRWYGAFIVATMLASCVQAIGAGRKIRAFEKTPRREWATCPGCAQHPPIGAYWTCSCGMTLDTFQTQGQCPACQQVFSATACPFCGESAPMDKWVSTGGFPIEAVRQPKLEPTESLEILPDDPGMGKS